MKKVLVVGSAENSGGGVTTVIKLIKSMPVWKEYQCHWIGTQIQAGKIEKLLCAFKAYVEALFVIWRYDIIHFHAVPDVSVWVQFPVFLLALIGRKKIIMHLHVGNQLGMDMCTKYRLAHWCMQKADLLVLLAHRFEPLLDEYWSEVKTKRVVLYNAIDTSHVKEESVKKSNTILFAGAFNYNKSGEVLIKAFARISDKHPDWTLQLLGSGPKENEYKELIKEYDIENQVEMPGYIVGKAKDDYFEHAGIYVMCSKYEGFPMVVLESWANGCPVITTPVGGLPDVLEDGKNAFVFDFDNVDQLAEKLDSLMADEQLRISMGANGKMLVMEQFSKSAINNQLDKIYKSLS